jgi:hypothetical protein
VQSEAVPRTHVVTAVFAASAVSADHGYDGEVPVKVCLRRAELHLALSGKVR